VLLVLLVVAGCREPPVRGRSASVEPPSAPEAEPVQPLSADELAGDLTLVYTRTWATGRWVRVTVSRTDGVIDATARTVWRKSSLMPERSYVLGFDGARLEKLLSTLSAGQLPAPVRDDGATPYCGLEVETPSRTWSVGAFCDSLTGPLATLWHQLTAQLHPRYLLARHLLEAGRHAEKRLDARDVYFYYVDGTVMLGSLYGPVEGDHTGILLEQASEAHGQERYVDAVVDARNALSSRLQIYERGRMEGLAVTLADPPGVEQKGNE
jgi:hypothetical protein